MKLVETANAYADLIKAKKEIDAAIEATRNIMMDELAALGLKQIKTDQATISIAKRVTPVVDEIGFRSWAVEQPDLAIDEFYIQSLDKKKVADYAQHLKVTTGEVVPFISATETEYLSVRTAKQEEQQ